MCGCEREKHEGIRCHEAGCTCHRDSATIWVLGGNGGLYGIEAHERVVQRLAEMYEDVAIYFFANLVEA